MKGAMIQEKIMLRPLLVKIYVSNNFKWESHKLIRHIWISTNKKKYWNVFIKENI